MPGTSLRGRPLRQAINRDLRPPGPGIQPAAPKASTACCRGVSCSPWQGLSEYRSRRGTETTGGPPGCRGVGPGSRRRSRRGRGECAGRQGQARSAPPARRWGPRRPDRLGGRGLGGRRGGRSQRERRARWAAWSRRGAVAAGAQRGGGRVGGGRRGWKVREPGRIGRGSASSGETPPARPAS